MFGLVFRICRTGSIGPTSLELRDFRVFVRGDLAEGGGVRIINTN